MKILAIDYGSKRMGFAIGNTILKTANPLEPLIRKNPKYDIAYIHDLITEYDIDTIVLGYPFNMDGSHSDISKKVDRFRDKLYKKLAITIELVDERLSSMEAENILKPIMKDFMRRKKVLDSMAAVVILKNFMEVQ